MKLDKYLTEEKATAEQIAKFFHDTYEKLASQHGYKTRKESAVPWSKVPNNNKSLMIAVAGKVIEKFIK